MIQAGRNGIIFHSCHAAFPFLHLSLSFGCAISFCKNQPFVKSCRPLFRKAGFFPFSLLSPFLSAGREHGSTPISRSAFCRHFVDIPFCGIATCCQFSVLFVATSIQSDRITRKSLPILRTYSRNAHHCAGGRIALSLPRCKDSMQTGTTLEVLTNGTAVQSSFIEPSGFAYGQK